MKRITLSMLFCIAFNLVGLYQLRSDSVAHAGNKQVTEADICLALDLLKDLIK